MDRCSREGEGWHGLDGSMDPRRWNQWIQVSAERCLRGARAAQIGGSVSIRAAVSLLLKEILSVIHSSTHAHPPLGSIEQILVRTANGTGPQCGSMDPRRLGRMWMDPRRQGVCLDPSG